MNSKELLEQAEKRIAEVESIKILVSIVNTLTQIISEVQRPVNDICMGELTEETNISGAIGAELNIRLKSAIAINLAHFLSEKNNELEKLLGIRHPAIINPEFEKAVQEMEQSVTIKKNCLTGEIVAEWSPGEEKSSLMPQENNSPEEPQRDKRCKYPMNMTEETIRQMYIVESQSMDEIAKFFGVKKSTVNNFIYLKGLRRTTRKNSKPLPGRTPTETERP